MLEFEVFLVYFKFYESGVCVCVRFSFCPHLIFPLGVCFCKVLNVLGCYSYVSLSGIAFKKEN